ncbi:carbohydrate ABC transporter permease [Undibacterium sp. TS12]|uniref:carbohydrate ABC transporter permease n=1 Tax=Undibacterium sp. TS12 TaxID=2908202 RepID=UPI001F4C7517|nr:carbohydrate ABC transporter permease [Undibacterium sp. TS12]MCH8621452.1 carbohydrate ABC transporter permease [Undibacterium sp. TS12]
MKRLSYTNGLLYAVLTLYSLLTLAPFVWAILTSLKSPREIAEAGSIWPQVPTLAAYETILQGPFYQWLWNSLLVATVVTLLNVLFNTMAGYALARFRFRGRGLVFQTLMLLIMVPSQVTMIPAYMIVARMGLVDTHLSVILTSAVSIGYIFMMRQFFVNFPVEIEEAATLDGSGRLHRFFCIVLPMARPALTTQAIFVFMGIWNEFMKPLLFISSVDKYLLTQGLNAVAKQYAKSSSWNLIMAGSVISILPILIMYITLNRRFLDINDQSSGIK